MEKPIGFKFSLLPGDLVNSLAGIKSICDQTNKKADIFLGLNIEWQMSDVVKAGREDTVTLTDKSLEMFRPLLLSQSYINSVESLEDKHPDIYKRWTGAFKDNSDLQTAAKYYMSHPEILVDIDKTHLVPIGLPHGNIFRWPFYCYPDLACDLSKPWLQVDAPKTNKIIINRTERSRNPNISYSFLSKYKDRLVFAGTYQEWLSFRQDTSMEIPLYTAGNFLELAMLIKSASFFIGNQSLCFSLAEAMKVNRVLEICPWLNNVIGCGEHFYDAYFQENLEYYVEYLANKE